MKKFEYHTLVVCPKTITNHQLDEWGRKGWELIEFVPDDHNLFIAVFKREIQPHATV